MKQAKTAADHNGSLLERFYAGLLAHPVPVFLVLLMGIAGLGYYIKDFQIEASADTLVNESGEDIQYSRKIYDRYHIQDFLVITYSPEKKDLLSDAVLNDIAALRQDLLQLEEVESVMTLLDVPLLESPPIPLKELSSGELPTLRSGKVDRELARQELISSPLYKNLLVSPDLKTTGIQVNLVIDEHYRETVAERDRLQEKKETGKLTAVESVRFQELEAELSRLRKEYNRENQQFIADVRQLMDQYEDEAELFLGGVSMIANDLIRFIKNDLKVFGLGVFCFLVIMLGVLFRQVRWILLPLLCCLLATIAMMGLLGLFGWKVTVISSNFISLQLIITMAISIHLIVRFRELQQEQPEAPQNRLIIETVRLKLTPCIYAALTTMAGFASLLLSDIKPVITFGWMMAGGIVASLIITFLFFPVSLALFPRNAPSVAHGSGRFLTVRLAEVTRRHGRAIILISLLALLLSLMGIFRLTVENSFVNYFKESTEIYQGMKVIDRKLGGTTPLDVIINFADSTSEPAAASGADAGADDEFAMFNEFDEAGAVNDQYWFTPYKMARILEIHDYLEQLPATGKVMSLGTMLKVARRLNHGKPLDSVELPLVYNELPEKYREQLVSPYVSVEHNQVRLNARIIDTMESLRRNQLLDRIKSDIVARFGYAPEQVHLTGMLVLYNNMLQRLFDSQIKTLGAVLLALMVMFLVLFRSFKIAVIAIFPNLLSIVVVLGVIGWLEIPMDMMTITIAAISVGIAVDDTIHYIHRFQREFALVPDYYRAMQRSHGSIGYAMYYTSVTIIIGFSILALSNFIPTIVFGLLTGLAMLIALLAALTLLPQLLVWMKPFGPEISAE